MSVSDSRNPSGKVRESEGVIRSSEMLNGVGYHLLNGSASGLVRRNTAINCWTIDWIFLAMREWQRMERLLRLS